MLDHESMSPNELRNGALRLEGKFKESISQAITVLVYLQFDSNLEIDRNKKVFPRLL